MKDHGSGTPLVDHVARWTAAFRSRELPGEVVERARLLVADSLGCALGGLSDHVGSTVLGMAEDMAGGSQCTLIGSTVRASLPQAVFANSTLVRCLDFNDFYWGPGQVGHPSDNLPVALAVGEWAGRSGAEVLRALILGYELYCRIEDASDPKGPWDHVTASGFAAPAMAAFLLGLDEIATAEAIAIGAVRAHTLACLRDGHLSEAKAFANASVAEWGALAAMLASRGLNGPRTSLDGPRGVRAGLLDQARSEALVQSFGEDTFRIMDVSIKAFPCVGVAQTPIAAALDARRSGQFAVQNVTGIELHLADARIAHGQLDPALKRPQSRESADHSCPYLVAAALLDGEVTIGQFERCRWADPDVVSLMNLIEVRPDTPIPAGGGSPCRLTVRTTEDSFTYEVLEAPGHPRRPMTRSDVLSKAESCSGGIPESIVRKVLEAGFSLDTAPTIHGLMRSLSFER